MLKKSLSVLLAVVMLLGVFAGLPTSAGAAGDQPADHSAVCEDYSYTVTDGNAVIDQYLGSAAALSVPSRLDGHPVTGIGSEAFRDNQALTDVTIPGTVTAIGSRAFYGCAALEKISIPDSVTVIGREAFHDTAWYDAQPDGFITVAKIAYGFKGELRAAPVIEPGVVGVSQYAFADAFDDTDQTIDLVLPDSITAVGEGAFLNCRSLGSVVIPASVTEIGEYAFGYRENEDGEIVKADGIVIYGSEESEAQKFALANGLTFIAGEPEAPAPAEEEAPAAIPEKDLAASGASAIDVAACEIIAEPSSFPYDGTEKEPKVTVRYEGSVLKAASDYTVTYRNNIKAGAADIIITGVGSYTGKKVAHFTITPRSIRSASVTLEASSCVYDGAEQKPGVTVKDGGVSLKNGTDYTVSYSDNINVGTAAVTVTGIGSYTGTADKTFTITKKTVSDATVLLSADSYTYDGTEKTPGVTVMDDDTVLEKDTDYTVTYRNNKNVGTAQAVITGKGNYAGTASESYLISTAAAISLSDCTITLSATQFNYDGTEKKPTVTVKYGSATLKEGTDFSVEYTNCINAGTACAMVTGKGNYSGTKPRFYTILPRSLQNAAIKLETSAYYYTGSERKPAVTATYDSTVLKKDTDFSVVYTDNVNAGTATVTVTGIGNYNGSQELSFTIKPKSITVYSLVLGTTSYTYDGSNKKPTVKVENDTKTLTKGTDYSVSYANCKNAGTATVTVTGMGNFTGTLSQNYTIKPKAIAADEVTMSTNSFTYNGAEKKPGFTVTDGDLTLKSGTDYTVAYSNNINAGTGTATLTGIGNYKGTFTKSFTIYSKSIASAAKTLSATSYVYDGTEKIPTVTVKDGDVLLKKDVDYTLTYANNKNVGTATVTITGKGNFKGSETKQFTITAKPIAASNVTLSAYTYIYDGELKKPDVTVKIGDKTLVKDVDYTLSYSGNRNIGTAYAIITGKGNYTETVRKSFTITEKPKTPLSGCTVTLSATAYTYDGKEKKPGVTVKFGDTTLKNGADYTLTYANNINAGTATVTITGTGDYKGTLTRNYTINAKSLSSVEKSLSTSSYAYTGTPRTPRAIIKDGDKTLKLNEDYTVAYANNTNAGTGTVTVTGTGNYKGSAKLTFTIAAKSISSTTRTLSAASFTYDGSAKTPGVTVMDGETRLRINVDYTVAYTNNINAGTGTVTITGMGNYKSTAKNSFTITPKSISSTTRTLSTTEYVYSGTERKPYVSVKDGETTLRKGTDYEVTYSNNVNAGTATATVTGMGNYKGTVKNTFSIKRKSIGKAIVTLSATSYTYDGTSKKPTVTVVLNEKELRGEDADYHVSYSGTIKAGTATVTVTGLHNYEGNVKKTFTINPKPITSASISLSATSYTYDGEAKMPAVTVKDGDTTLVNGTNYTLRYADNKKAGTASVTITGKGNYGSSVKKTFTIYQKSLSSATITLGATSYIYNGEARKPYVSVKFGEKALRNGTDFTVAYSGNRNAGTATARITGKGNFKDIVYRYFTIQQKSISSATATLSSTEYTYNGSERKPYVSLKLGETSLKNGTDYSVTYTNNINAGTATATITGIGNYKSTLKKTFTINKKSLGSFTMTLGTTSYTYDGNLKTPYVTVKYDSVTLRSGTDYTVTYSGNRNAGTATATVTGKGNYTGTLKKTFTISQRSISGASITLGATEYTYDGTAKKPAVTVKIGDTTLINGTNYTVAYSANKNAGTASARITGKGNYKDVVYRYFTITPKSLSGATVTLSSTGYTYDGTAKKPAVTVKIGDTTLRKDTDYTVSYSNNVNAGTATVTITGKGNFKYTIYKYFTIYTKSISSATLSLSSYSYTYDGTAKKPSVTVTLNSSTLSSSNYTVSYTHNVDAGTATVTVYGSGNYSGSVSKNFTINKRSLSSATVTLSPSSYEYDGTAKKPSVTVTLSSTTLRNGTDYDVTYSNNVNIGTAKATITGKNNYSGSTSKNFTITPKVLSVDCLTYNFYNNQYDFNYPDNYYIGIESYRLIFGNSSKAYEMKEAMDYWGPWDGSCFGMSNTSALFNVPSSGVKVTQFRSSASKVKDLSIYDSNGSYNVLRFIEAMQVGQLGDSIMDERDSHKNDLTSLYNAVSRVPSTGKPVSIGIRGSIDGHDGGHEVLGYSTEKISSTEYRINIYDPNFAKTKRYITLKANSSGTFTSWSYRFNDYYDWGTGKSYNKINYVNYSTIEKLWKGSEKSGSASNILSVNSGNFSLYDSSDQPVATVTNGDLSTTQDDIKPVELYGITRNPDQTLLRLPADSYTLKNNEESTEELTATMIDFDRAATVTTSSDEITFDVNDDAAINEASINTEEGDTYEITLSSSDDSEKDAITVTGVADGDEVAASTVDGELALTNCEDAEVTVKDDPSTDDEAEPNDSSQILGDADGSGEVDVIDVTFLQRMIADPAASYSSDVLQRCDVDCSGEIDVIDVTAIRYYLTNRKSAYPIGSAVNKN